MNGVLVKMPYLSDFEWSTNPCLTVNDLPIGVWQWMIYQSLSDSEWSTNPCLTVNDLPIPVKGSLIFPLMNGAYNFDLYIKGNCS
jgi:hypothetical protein